MVYLALVILIDYAQQDIGFRQWCGRWLKREPKIPAGGDRDSDFELKMLRHKRDEDVLDEETAVGNLTAGDMNDPEVRSVVVRSVSKVFKVARTAVEGGAGEDGGPLSEEQSALDLDTVDAGRPSGRRSRIAAGATVVPPATGMRSCLRNGVSSCFACVRDAFSNKNLLYAVKDVSFSLRKGEVFGLLGVNGAGKSTLFRMLCGIEVPCVNESDHHAAGGNRVTDIRVGGKSLFEQRDAVRKKIGYCAQGNPLWPDATVREHLHLYAKIKVQGFFL